MSSLYLVPSLLGESDISVSLTPFLIETVRTLRHFIVENEKTARAFLKKCGINPPYDHINLHLLDKHTTRKEKEGILAAIKGSDAGLLSEAGAPAVADPGSDIILMAHNAGFLVRPLVGPSSILLALMAAGFNGQGFTFHGYLPIQSTDRIRTIRELETVSAQTGYTHLFIETPFRNESLLADLVKTCRPETWVSVAVDLTLPTEQVISKPVSRWPSADLQLKGRPAVFSLWVPAAAVQKPKYVGKDRDY